MTTVLDRVTEVQDQVIEAITSVKEPVTTAVAAVVDFVLERAPEVPALPFAEQIPTPKELIDNQAKFASKLVTANKQVALSVAAAAKPLNDQLLDRTSRPAARSTKAAA
jgi:hypothetical protein